MLPVVLAHGRHMLAEVWFELLTAVLMASSLIWALALTHRAKAFRDLALMAVFGVCALYLLVREPNLVFGEREYLLIVFTLPYLLALSFDVIKQRPWQERVALGIFAAPGIWLKPYHVLILIAVEVAIAIRRRSLARLISPEVLSLVAACLGILALILALAPDYLRTTYPLLKDTYWALGTHNILAMIRVNTSYNLLLVAAVVLWVLLRKRLRQPAASAYLLLASVAASLACDIQQINWPYHYLPQKFLLLLGLAALVLDAASAAITRMAADRRTFSPARTVIFAFVILLVAAVRVASFHPWRPHPSPLLEDGAGQLLTGVPAGTTVTVLSPNLEPLEDVYHLNLTWGSRFPHQWMVPALILNKIGPKPAPAPFKRLTPNRLKQLADVERGAAAEDLASAHPAYVVIAHCSDRIPCLGLTGKTFDLLAWFLEDDRFRQAFTGYTLTRHTANWDVYRVAAQGD